MARQVTPARRIGANEGVIRPSMVQHPRATRNGDTVISARRFGHRVCSFKDAISISAKRVAKVDQSAIEIPS